MKKGNKAKNKGNSESSISKSLLNASVVSATKRPRNERLNQNRLLGRFSSQLATRKKVMGIQQNHDKFGRHNHTLKDARNIFKAIDVDGNGTLSQNEFHQALCKLGMGFRKDETAELFRSVDLDSSGAINRREFISLLQNQGFIAADVGTQKGTASTISEGETKKELGLKKKKTKRKIRKRRKKKMDKTGNRWNRLYTNGLAAMQKRKDMIAKAEETREAQLLAEQAYYKSLSTHPASSNTSLYSRSIQFLKSRDARLTKERERHLENVMQPCTFRPEIHPAPPRPTFKKKELNDQKDSGRAIVGKEDQQQEQDKDDETSLTMVLLSKPTETNDTSPSTTRNKNENGSDMVVTKTIPTKKKEKKKKPATSHHRREKSSSSRIAKSLALCEEATRATSLIRSHFRTVREQQNIVRHSIESVISTFDQTDI
eukprot:g3421.t1